jgi:8-oxo-dGTP pyrophosphatase MutT (NUDIX family)
MVCCEAGFAPAAPSLLIEDGDRVRSKSVCMSARCRHDRLRKGLRKGLRTSLCYSWCMELNLEATNAPARASATVVMLRDGEAGLEVFMLERHGLSDVLGGAYVFPGGKVDALDSDEAALSRLDRTLQQLHAALHEPLLSPVEAAALFAAALRETFEEAGVQLAASDLVPWSRWITPVIGGVVRKRFDTRFFLAQLAPGQTPRHDDHEAVASAWLAPRDALKRYWDGVIELAPPQIMSLAHLARYASAHDAMAAARLRHPPLIHPEPFFEQGGMRVMCYPGDERHSVRERALPGPTRLHHRGGRFEPADGFEGLFVD